MANLFFNLPSPLANGSGAPVDVSTMGMSKTISVAGLFVASVTIEITNEIAPTTWAPLITFNVPDGIVLDVAARWMRVTVIGYKSGAPVVDVGGTDDGALFASLPVPAGDGPGVAVNTATLPLFKTATVGGPFRGNVQLEVSEDGITNWSQLGFGFQNPGQQSQVMAAQWMRAVRSGVPLIDPGLPIIDVGACPTGGGGVGPPGPPGSATPTCFIYRPGSALTGPVVFDDWDDLYATMQAQRATSNGSGCYAIEFDDLHMTPVVPAGSYDMDMCIWTSVHGQRGLSDPIHTADLSDGTAITNLRTIVGLEVHRGAGGAAACITLVDTLTLIGGAGLASGTAAPLAELSGVAAGLIIGEYCYVGGVGEAAAAIVVTAGGVLNVYLQGAGGPSDNILEFAFSDDVGTGTVNVYASESSSVSNPSQIYMTLPMGVTQVCPMWSWDGDPNGVIAGLESGFKLIDRTTGTQWRCTADNSTIWVVDSATIGSNVFTYRPGSGLTGPSVFDDFNTLYAAFDAARTAAQVSGKFKIVFDDQDVGFGSAVIVDSGAGSVTYDFLYAELIGVHEDANTLVRMQDGGGEGDTLTVINALWWEGITLEASGQGPLILAADNQTFTLTRTIWSGNGGDRVLLVLAVTGVIIHLNDESQIFRDGVFPAGVAPVQVNTATLTVHANGANCQVNANAFVSGGGASLVAIINSSSARFDANQADVGGVSLTMSTAAGYWTFGAPGVDLNPNGDVTATAGTLIMDEATGFIWRSEGGTVWSRFDVEPSPLPEQWAVQNVPAATGPTAMSAQVSTNFDDIKMVRDGSVVSISTRLTEAVTAGTLTATVTVNGVAAALAVVMGVASLGGQTLVVPGIVPYVTGDLIGVTFTSSGGFTPITTDLEAWLEVAETF